MAIHHVHLRKRVHQKLEPYPNPEPWKNLLDKLVFGVALFSALMTIPQILQIWGHSDSSGVSVLSWGAYTLASCFWVGYGLVHREPVIITVYSLFAVLNFLVVLGALLH